jgi:trimeric autotransporter adhesin
VRTTALFLLASSAAFPQWRITTFAGGSEAGDGGPSSQASLRFVQGLAVAPSGEIFLADSDDHRIRRIDTQGRITTISGDGLPGRNGDNGPAHLARVNTPYGLSYGPNNDLYIADLGNARVRRVNSSGQIETLAGAGLGGVTLQAPRNVLAAPDGRLYISDFAANRILILEPRGNFNVLPAPSPNFNSPAGLTLDPSGNLYIADSGNGRVLRYSIHGLYTVHASGLNRPTGLAWHPDGYLLIADVRGDFLWRVNARGHLETTPTGGRDVAVDRAARTLTAGGTWVRRTMPSGLLEILIGNQFNTFRGENVPAPQARLHRPTGVAVDSHNNVYFSDTQNHRVRRVGPQGIVTTVAGNGEPGFRGDGARASQAQLNLPTALAIDALDNLYIADSGNQRVRVVSSSGVILTAAGTGRAEFSNDNIAAAQASLSGPAGLAVDASNRVYVSERTGQRIRRFTLGGRIETVAGSGARGVPQENGEALLAPLNEPTALSIDAVGNLFLVDRANHALRKIDARTQRLTTLASSLKTPESVAVSPKGVVFFSESQTHTISRIALDGKVTVIAGRPNENGFNAENGNADALTLNEPQGLALQGESVLYFADRLNDRIRRLESPPELITADSQTKIIAAHAATFATSPIAPGLLMTLFTPPLENPQLSEITLDGFPAPISFANRTQVNFQVPYAIAGRSGATLELRNGGLLIDRTVCNVAAAAPAFFEVAGKRGQAVAVLPNGQLNGEENPARPGEIVVLYATGEGLRMDVNGYEVPFLGARVDVQGLPAELLYAGGAPGFPGLFQVNLRVPNSLRAAGAVTVNLKVGQTRNPTTQTIFVY